MTGFTPGKALVVGGRGFLGRHIVTALTAAGFEVIETVRDGSGDAGGAVALDLLTSPASTAETTSRVSLSVTRSP